MAAEDTVKINVQVTELSNTARADVRFVDATTPTDYFKGYVVISTAETVLSTVCNIPTEELMALYIKAEGTGGVYAGIISTTGATLLSIRAAYIGNDTANYMSFASTTVSYDFAVKGDNAASAIDFLAIRR